MRAASLSAIRPSAPSLGARSHCRGAAVTSTERLQQFTVRGGAVWSLLRLDRWGIAPFVTAEAGYLRELHEAQGGTPAQTRETLHLGALILAAPDIDLEILEQRIRNVDGPPV